MIRDMPLTATCGSEEARNELPQLLQAAQSGRATIITRHGKPVAALVPIDQYQDQQVRQQSLLAVGGTGKGMWGRSSQQTVRKLRDEWTR
jgi:prevent-host-death family protein